MIGQGRNALHVNTQAVRVGKHNHNDLQEDNTQSVGNTQTGQQSQRTSAAATLTRSLGCQGLVDVQVVLTAVHLCECIYMLPRGGPERVHRALNVLSVNFPPGWLDINYIQIYGGSKRQRHIVGVGRHALYVAVMGSKERRDIFTNMDAILHPMWTDWGPDLDPQGLAPMPEQVDDSTQGKGPQLPRFTSIPCAHRGFHQRMSSMPIEQLQTQANEAGLPLIFTGHSLGGAVANLCTLQSLWMYHKATTQSKQPAADEIVSKEKSEASSLVRQRHIDGTDRNGPLCVAERGELGPQNNAGVKDDSRANMDRVEDLDDDDDSSSTLDGSSGMPACAGPAWDGNVHAITFAAPAAGNSATCELVRSMGWEGRFRNYIAPEDPVMHLAYFSSGGRPFINQSMREPGKNYLTRLDSSMKPQPAGSQTMPRSPLSHQVNTIPHSQSANAFPDWETPSSSNECGTSAPRIPPLKLKPNYDAQSPSQTTPTSVVSLTHCESRVGDTWNDSPVLAHPSTATILAESPFSRINETAEDGSRGSSPVQEAVHGAERSVHNEHVQLWVADGSIRRVSSSMATYTSPRGSWTHDNVVDANASESGMTDTYDAADGESECLLLRNRSSSVLSSECTMCTAHTSTVHGVSYGGLEAPEWQEQHVQTFGQSCSAPTTSTHFSRPPRDDWGRPPLPQSTQLESVHQYSAMTLQSQSRAEIRASKSRTVLKSHSDIKYIARQHRTLYWSPSLPRTLTPLVGAARRLKPTSILWSVGQLTGHGLNRIRGAVIGPAIPMGIQLYLHANGVHADPDLSRLRAQARRQRRGTVSIRRGLLSQKRAPSSPTGSARSSDANAGATASAQELDAEPSVSNASPVSARQPSIHKVPARRNKRTLTPGFVAHHRTRFYRNRFLLLVRTTLKNAAIQQLSCPAQAVAFLTSGAQHVLGPSGNSAMPGAQTHPDDLVCSTEELRWLLGPDYAEYDIVQHPVSNDPLQESAYQYPSYQTLSEVTLGSSVHRSTLKDALTPRNRGVLVKSTHAEEEGSVAFDARCTTLLGSKWAAALKVHPKLLLQALLSQVVLLAVTSRIIACTSFTLLVGLLYSLLNTLVYALEYALEFVIPHKWTGHD